MKIYLSGPMSGIAGHNFPYFDRVAARLRERGLVIVNPADINREDTEASWASCIRKDIIELMTCTDLLLLRGWQRSAGAQLELHLAHRVGMKIWTEAEFTQEMGVTL